jgi:formate/nitrite transporter FocA (FNT family)
LFPANKEYLKPDEVAKNMLQTAVNKASLSVSDFLIRGFLSGALLGFATCLAFTASKQTTFPIVGALIFPVGFVLIVLLGLELVTGNFALVPRKREPSKRTIGPFLCILAAV